MDKADLGKIVEVRSNVQALVTQKGQSEIFRKQWKSPLEPNLAEKLKNNLKSFFKNYPINNFFTKKKGTTKILCPNIV